MNKNASGQTQTADINKSILLIIGTALPDRIREPLWNAFLPQITAYSIDEFERGSPSPELILLWVETEDGFEKAMKPLSEFVQRSPLIVLARQDNADLARKALSLGAKAYIPVPRGCEIVIEVMHFILAGLEGRAGH